MISKEQGREWLNASRKSRDKITWEHFVANRGFAVVFVPEDSCKPLTKLEEFTNEPERSCAPDYITTIRRNDRLSLISRDALTTMLRKHTHTEAWNEAESKVLILIS